MTSAPDAYLTPRLRLEPVAPAPNSLTVLRIPSALAAGLIVLLTSLLAREFGGDRRAELTAALSIAVGTGLGRHLRGCRIAAHVTNPAGIDNDENGAPIMICTGPRTTWSREWPSIKRLG